MFDAATPEDQQEVYWRSYCETVKQESNVIYRLEDDGRLLIVASKDMSIGNDLFLNCPGRWLCIMLNQLTFEVVVAQNHMVPRSIIDAADPDLKNRFWVEKREQTFEFLLDAETYHIVGAKHNGEALASTRKKYRLDDTQRIVLASPETVKMWQRRLIHLLRKKVIKREAVDKDDAFMMGFTRGLLYEQFFQHFTEKENPYGFAVIKAF